MRALLVPAALVLAGCTVPADMAFRDLPAVAPPIEFWDVPRARYGFHTADEIAAFVADLAAQRPDLVRLATIGESVQGRPIHALVVANRSLDGAKPAPFIDGGHHANELEGIEITLYLADFLVQNYERNATVRGWVDRMELWIVPLVNPDGYAAQSGGNPPVARGNARGVNINRNYDVDWGNPRGSSSFVMGDIAHRTGQPMPSCGLGLPCENSGNGPWSEPESVAIRDALAALDGRLAFYISHHTSAHCITAPWAAAEPPHPVPPEHRRVIEAVYAWVEANTEFAADDMGFPESRCMSYTPSGSSMDWAYLAHGIPSFTMETGGTEATEGAGPGDPVASANVLAGAANEYFGLADRGLPHYMQATLPIELYLLANAEELQAWREPAREPPMPADG